jgi:uncharacterized protein YggE
MNSHILLAVVLVLQVLGDAQELASSGSAFGEGILAYDEGIVAHGEGITEVAPDIAVVSVATYAEGHTYSSVLNKSTALEDVGGDIYTCSCC